MSWREKIDNRLIKWQKIPADEKIFFVQHLRVMIKAGVPFAEAMEVLAQQTANKHLQQVLKTIQEGIEKGETFSAGLKKFPKVFNELFVNMIEAGEASGRIEEALERLYGQIKKDHDIKSKIKGAMIYPSVVLCAMVLIGGLMVVFVIPKITAVFKNSNVPLPLTTRILMGTSAFVRHHGIITILSIIAVVYSFIWIIRTKKGKYYFHSFLLSAPIIGKIIKKINIARFSRTLSSLLATDIPIERTLKITARVLGNVRYKEAVFQASEEIVKGVNIADTLKKYPRIFSPVVTEMIMIGEKTGSLDNVLEEMATFYEEEVSQTMKNLPSIIEPILILLLGMGVGFIAVSVIMPMYSLTAAI